MRGMVENYCPEVNSRLRLNFTEGAIISYHFPDKRAVNICFIHPFIDFLVRTKPGKMKKGYRVQNLAAVTAFLRFREIVKTNTHGFPNMNIVKN